MTEFWTLSAASKVKRFLSWPLNSLPAPRGTEYLRQGERVMIPGWKYPEEGKSLGHSDMRFFKQGLLDTLWDQNEQDLNLSVKLNLLVFN